MTRTPPAAVSSLDAEEPLRLRVRDPGDLVALVPYLLHFHPEDSIVVLLLTDGRVVLTARLDLPPPNAVADVVEQIDHLRRRTRADACVVLGYGARPQDRATVTTLVERLGPDLLEALWVEPERWWSLVCTGACCPPEGQVYDARAHPMAATAVLAGLDAGGNRAELAALATGPSPADEVVLRRRCDVVGRRLGGARRSRQRRVERLVNLLTGRREPPTVDEALLLGLLCVDVEVRDVVFTRMDRGNAGDHLRVWAATVGQVPGELSSAPLCLLAVAGWLSGNGALLNCCLERLATTDPAYPMFEILSRIADAAVPPSVWADWMGGLRGDLELRPW